MRAGVRGADDALVPLERLLGRRNEDEAVELRRSQASDAASRCPTCGGSKRAAHEGAAAPARHGY